MKGSGPHGCVLCRSPVELTLAPQQCHLLDIPLNCQQPSISPPPLLSPPPPLLPPPLLHPPPPPLSPPLSPPRDGVLTQRCVRRRSWRASVSPTVLNGRQRTPCLSVTCLSVTEAIPMRGSRCGPPLQSSDSSFTDDHVGLNVLRCRADRLGTESFTGAIPLYYAERQRNFLLKKWW